MPKQTVLLSFMVLLMAAIVYSAGGVPSVEVKGFTGNQRTSLPIHLKDRTWTEVRSSLYDGEGGTRLFIVLPQSNQASTGVVKTGFSDYTEWKNIAETDGAIPKKNFPLSVHMINTAGKNTNILTDYFKAANGTNQANNANANDVVYNKSGSSPWTSKIFLLLDIIYLYKL